MAFMNSLVDGRDLSIRGLVENGVTTARFDLQGVKGELRRAENADEPRLKFESLELKRAPAVLAVAGALLPARGELPMTVDDLRYAGISLGSLHSRLTRRDAGVEFSLESATSSPHQLTARGDVRRCGLALPRQFHGRYAQSRCVAGRCAPARGMAHRIAARGR